MVCWSLSLKKIVLGLFLVSSFNTLALDKVGSGLLTFTIFSFEIYELELYSDKKIKAFSELKDVDKYKMVFTFRKNIKSDYLKEAWTESQKVFPAKVKGDYFKQLENIQPDMKDGDQIVILADADTVEFKFPGKSLKFKDSTFKKNVPWIWLGANEVGEKLAPQIFKSPES